MYAIIEEFPIGINPLVLVKLQSRKNTMGKLPFPMINGQVLLAILLHAHPAQSHTLST